MAKTAPSRRTLLLAAAGGAVVLLAVVLLRSRQAAAGRLDPTSGTPGPDLTGSAAQQPSGGASSIPGKLPDALLVSSDPVTEQVQATDAGSEQAPASLGTGVVASTGPYGFTTYTDVASGSTYTTDVGGTTTAPSYNPSTGSWFEGSLPSYLPLPTTSPASPSMIAAHAAAGRDPVL